MSAQFGRLVSLIASTGTSQIDLSALKITFRIEQQDLQTPNRAYFRLWNVADQTAKLLQDEFTSITLQVGYEGSAMGTLWSGSIVQAISGRVNATDTFVDILASDGDEAYNFACVNQTLAAGATADDQVQAIAGAMGGYGVRPGYIAGVPSAPLPRAKVLYGMVRDPMRQLMQSAGSNWSIQDRQLQVMPITGYLPGDAVVLTADTGMIELPQQTQDGISVRCLINPQITPGRRVQIDNRSIQKAQISLAYTAINFLPRVTDDGFYRVIVANHSGDTRDNEWYSDLVCIALDDAVTPGLAAKGYG